MCKVLEHAQVFASTQLAAQALATAINSDPASVFKMLVANRVHGKAYNVAIAGPSTAPPAGAHQPENKFPVIYSSASPHCCVHAVLCDPRMPAPHILRTLSCNGRDTGTHGWFVRHSSDGSGSTFYL